ncbi:hypothetical protein [Kitasatospora sp. NPDC090091]|uniref:hypothetical protein n=1 Tax=Kitasatospora sp. NPDC090091 TaxID=3364081 RepID=UPI00380D0787
MTATASSRRRKQLEHPTADRFAALREQAQRHDNPSAGFSNLELLTAAYESVLREQIYFRDRHMGLLASLHKHNEQVRAVATSARTAVPRGRAGPAPPRPRISPSAPEPFYDLQELPMSERASSSHVPRPERLAGSPVVRRGSQWWLVTSTGSILATDPAFTGELDRFAAAMAVADREVARLRDERAVARNDR